AGDWPPIPAPVGPVDARALEAAADLLAARCPGRVSRDLSLAPLTTFRLGGPAAVFLRAESLDDLAALAVVLRDAPVPLLIVGRGSKRRVAAEVVREMPGAGFEAVLKYLKRQKGDYPDRPLGRPKGKKEGQG